MPVFGQAAACLQQLDDDLGCARAKRGKIAIEFWTDLDKLGPRRRKKHVEVDRSKWRGDRPASTGHRVADGTSPRGPG